MATKMHMRIASTTASGRRLHHRNPGCQARRHGHWPSREMLDDAATYFRKAVEPARKVPGVLKFGRKSKPHTVFMSMGWAMI